MKGIKRNEEALESTAATLTGIGERIAQTGSNLDSALRPARRSDVPELGQIDALYAGLRSRISNSATTLNIQGRDLRTYASVSRRVEALNILLLAKANSPFAIAMGPRHAGGFPSGVRWLDHGSDVSMSTMQTLMARATEHLLDGEALKHAGFAHVLGRLSFVAAMVSSMHDLFRGKDGVEKFAGAVGLASSGVSVLAGLDKLAAAVAGRSQIGWLSKTGPLGWAVSGGMVIGEVGGRFRYAEMARLEAMGLDPVDVAHQQLKDAVVQPPKFGGPIGGRMFHVVHAEYNVVTAELSYNEWIGKKFFGAAEEGPNDYLGNHHAAVVHAGLQEQFPGAVIVQQDNGKFTIRVPNQNALPAYSMVYDNKTGKLVAG